MPYIKSEDYVRAVEAPAVPGELNYALTMKALAYFRGVLTLPEFGEAVGMLCAGFMERNGPSYTSYNNLIGAMTCCGWELVRRANDDYAPAADVCQKVLVEVAYHVYYEIVVPYEDDKIAENGDVFPRQFVTDGS